MADTIIINSGVVKKVLETTDGKTCELSFNPSDPAFADRLYTAFDALKKKQDARDNNVEKMSAREMFDWMREMNAEMRETIDNVFGQPVCETLFGGTSVYASADGAPLWMNLMVAIMDELDEGIKREKAFHSEKLAKYTAKYHR